MANWMRRGLVLGGLGFALSLAACGQPAETGASQTTNSETQQTGTETRITGSGSAVTVEGEGATADGSVATITKAGTYRLSGTVNDGQIRVDAGKEDEVELILDGFSIANSSSSAIYGVQSKIISIVLEENSENTISDGETYTYENPEDDEPDAALFSKDDLIFEGKGTLTVKGNYQDAIRGKDDVTVRSGTYLLTAENDGIKGKDSVEIEGGAFTITAGADGIQSSNDQEEGKGTVQISDGSFTIEAGKKGILAVSEIAITGGTFQIETQDDAVHCDGNIRLAGGSFTLLSGDDAIHADQNVTIDDGKIHILKAYEGIEGLSIDINGGEITLTAEDDGLNAAGGTDSSGNGGRFADDPFSKVEGAYVRITDGILRVDASGDGIDSNGGFYMDGGTVYVEGPENNGNGTIDYNGAGEINGGTFIGTGSSGMLQAFESSSKQNLLILYYDEEQAAGTEIRITGSDGNEIAQAAPSKKFSSLIFSSPALADNAVLQVTTGESVVEITIDGVVTRYGTPAERSGGPMRGRVGGRGAMENGDLVENGERVGRQNSIENGGEIERPKPPAGDGEIGGQGPMENSGVIEKQKPPSDDGEIGELGAAGKEDGAEMPGRMRESDLAGEGAQAKD